MELLTIQKLQREDQEPAGDGLLPDSRLPDSDHYTQEELYDHLLPEPDPQNTKEIYVNEENEEGERDDLPEQEEGEHQEQPQL